eukprot:8114394-Alexandrium_andersonii.AAC.1
MCVGGRAWAASASSAACQRRHAGIFQECGASGRGSRDCWLLQNGPTERPGRGEYGSNPRSWPVCVRCFNMSCGCTAGRVGLSSGFRICLR